MPRKNPSKQPAKKALSAASAAAKRIRATRAGMRQAPASKKPHPAAKSPVFMAPETYKAHIDGMMAQGLDRTDAVDTLKVGIRQANGRPVPQQLMTVATAG